MMCICNISFNLPFMRLFYVLSLGLLLVFFAIHPNDLKADTNFCQDQDSVDVLFCKDFQSHSTGLYTSNQLKNDWPNLQSLSTKFPVFNLGITQKRVAIENLKGNSMLKILYPKDSYGPWMTGATWKMQLPGLASKQSYEHISLEYKVMFKEGFLYDREGLFGGKLPGLMGGENISGGKIADGRNGWTSRLMWGQLGRGLGYIYYPDMKNDEYNQKACPHYGLNHELCVIKRNKYFTFDTNSERKCISEWARDEFEFRFKTEQLYKIKQQLKMNTLPENETGSDIKEGNRDGQMRIWLDDKLVLECNNIRFRDIPQLGIDSLLFSTFFGGNTPESSAHPHDEFIYFDDFIIRSE